MIYLERAPSRELRPFVDRLWALDGAAALDAAGVAPILPDGHPELIVHCGDPFLEARPDGFVRQPGILLAGQQRHAVRLRPGGTISVVGARLRPEGAALLFGGSQDALTDRIVDLRALNAALSRRITCDVVDRDTATQRMRLLDRLLVHEAERRRLDPIIAQACALALNRRGLVSVTRLSSHAGLSPRQLERRFRDRVGITPKRFLRVIRFQEVLRALADRRDVDWAEMAVTYGFYDQPHFLKDFKEFTGETPSSLSLADQSITGVFSIGRRRNPASLRNVGFLQDADGDDD